MQERRKNERHVLNSTLLMKRLDGSAAQEINISITDVSKDGIGFTCPEALTIGAVYEANLQIWTKEILHAFLEIVRIVKENGTFNYGAIFIGMPETDIARISVYETVEKMTGKN